MHVSPFEKVSELSELLMMDKVEQNNITRPSTEKDIIIMGGQGVVARDIVQSPVKVKQIDLVESEKLSGMLPTQQKSSAPVTSHPKELEEKLKDVSKYSTESKDASMIITSTSKKKLSRDLNTLVKPPQRIPEPLHPPVPWDIFIKMQPPEVKSEDEGEGEGEGEGGTLYKNNRIASHLPEAMKTLLHVEVNSDGSLKSPWFCSDGIEKKLSVPFLNESDVKWCKWALDQGPDGGKVKVGSSWGRLTKNNDRARFDLNNCNSVAAGSNPTCDSVWGDDSVKSWARSRHPNVPSASICSNGERSNVECFINEKKDTYCILHKAQISFSLQWTVRKEGAKRPSRKFDHSYISVDCPAATTAGNVTASSTNADKSKTAASIIDAFPFPYLFNTTIDPKRQCDYIVKDNVLLYSHDNVLNLAHTMEDLMNVWFLMWLDHGNAKNIGDTILLSIDALRLYNNFNDVPSSFFQTYYQSFKDFFPGSAFGSKTVCFERLVMQTHPTKSFVWDNWHHDLPCSFIGPSSLYQRWNFHVRHSYGLLEADNKHLKSVNEKIKVILIERKESANDWGSYRSSRLIINLNEVKNAISRHINTWMKSESNKEGVQVEFEVRELARLEHIDQLRLIAETSILVGVHGAGIAHLMHMSLGAKYCCGVIEVFPKGEFSPVRGFANMARKMGFKHDRLDVNQAGSLHDGTIIPVEELALKVVHMINAIATESPDKTTTSNPNCVLKDVVENPFLEH